ncbi:MAG: DMT family transporter [Bacteroidales bacterium]|nr:DMT family transporter [Bacteroidales bacterium]
MTSGKSYVYALLAILFWSTVPTAFKLSLAQLSVLHMLAIAAFTSTVILFLIVIVTKKTRHILRSSTGDIMHSALLGLVNPFLYYIILLKAYQLLPAQVAQPLNMIWPIILVFLSIPLLGQKIRRKSFIALFISFIGVYIISSQGNLFGHEHSNTTGVLLATGSAVFWALYFILNVRDQRDEAVKLFLNFLFASFYIIVAMAVTGNWIHTDYPLKGFMAAIYTGVFEMGITFFLWLKALKLASSTDKISNLVYLAPFLSLVFIHFILHEPVYFTTPLGLVFIISGIWIQNHRRANG